MPFSCNPRGVVGVSCPAHLSPWCQTLFLLDVAVVAVFPRSVSNFKQAGNDFGRFKSLILQGSRCQTILFDYTRCGTELKS
jgi:hypothetical protein